MFLVTNENMGLCLYIQTIGGFWSIEIKNKITQTFFNMCLFIIWQISCYGDKNCADSETLKFTIKLLKHFLTCAYLSSDRYLATATKTWIIGGS